MDLRIKKQQVYWEQTAQRDWDLVLVLWRARKYDTVLFFCHLTLEKFLKAVVVKTTGTDAPRIHNLLTLARMAEIPLTDFQKNLLTQISYFNISVRYPSDKGEIRRMTRYSYAQPFFKFTKEFVRWLKKNQL